VRKRNAKWREGPGNGGHECVVMQCEEARVGQRWRGEDQTEVVAIATALTPVWNNIRENDASREGIRSCWLLKADMTRRPSIKGEVGKQSTRYRDRYCETAA
jgi:hypothetical protein